MSEDREESEYVEDKEKQKMKEAFRELLGEIPALQTFFAQPPTESGPPPAKKRKTGGAGEVGRDPPGPSCPRERSRRLEEESKYS